MIAPKEYPGASIKPYIVGDYSTIGGGGFGQSAGAGLSARLPVMRTFRVEPRVEYRKISVSNPNMPYSSQYVFNTGSLLTGSLAAVWNVWDGVTLNASVLAWRNSGATPATSSRETAVQAGAKIDFDPPSETIGWRWSVSPFFRYAAFNFDAADWSINPLVARRDQQWRVGAILDMPITPDWGLSANLQYTRTNSNIPNFNASFWSVLIGPTYRFTSVFDRRTAKDQASPVAARDWAGLHAGLNAGMGFGGDKSVDFVAAPASAQPTWEPDAAASALGANGRQNVGGSAFAVGAQAGYSWLFDSALAGVEADFDIFAPSQRASRFFALNNGSFVNKVYSANSATRRLDWLTSLRGRLGYLVTPQLLLFGTAGPATGGFRSTGAITQILDFGAFIPGATDYRSSLGARTGVRVGYAAGAGLQWMFKPGWSLRVEYLYHDLGRVGYAMTPLADVNGLFCTGVCFSSGARASTKLNGNVVRAGLDYHFVLGAALGAGRAVTK